MVKATESFVTIKNASISNITRTSIYFAWEYIFDIVDGNLFLENVDVKSLKKIILLKVHKSNVVFKNITIDNIINDVQFFMVISNSKVQIYDFTMKNFVHSFSFMGFMAIMMCDSVVLEKITFENFTNKPLVTYNSKG